MAAPVSDSYSAASGKPIYGGRIDPGAGVGRVTGFSLVSATAGTKPFTLGLGLKKGDATAITIDLANHQIIVKRTWSDGSIKHAIISGRATLAASTPLAVNVNRGAPASGTNLTSASIAAAALTATVQCGVLGTVSLADLLASPFRTWISGPEMVECHYRADVPSTLLAVWFHVRLYADGRLRVRTIVENGYLDNGAGAVAANATQTYDPTVTIGGSVVYAGTALAHYANTSWSAEGWIGGDPAVVPAYDISYLLSTKLVPNYAMGKTPSSGVLNALASTYTPMMQGDWSTAMGGVGYQAQIGLLPNWEAMFCASGDARALNALEVNAKALRSYPIVWRDKTTKLPVKPSTFPTWTYAGPGQGGTDVLGAGPVSWEINHHPSGGYLAYLLTGDYSYYETLALHSATLYCAVSSARGSGVNRLMQPPQIRGIAWCLRTLAQFAALAPDGDAVAAEYRTLLANSFAYWSSQGPENVSASQLGWPIALSTYDDTQKLTQAPWMMHFWIASNGHAWDIEPGFADTSKHLAIRDWMYKGAVGILGGNGTDNYCYTAASAYELTISDVVQPFFALTTPDKFYTTWGQVFAATTGADNLSCGTALGGGSAGAPTDAATGYWGNLLPAIAYAVDHAAPGAQAAWDRMTGATNWSDVVNSGFGDVPVWGVVPR